MEPPAPAQVIWYALSHQADLRAENIRSGFSGLQFDLCWKQERQPVQSALVGRINVLNILAAAGAALSYGVGLPAIARGVAAELGPLANTQPKVEVGPLASPKP